MTSLRYLFSGLAALLFAGCGDPDFSADTAALAEADLQDTDSPTADEDVARVSVCNALRWGEDNVELYVRCGEYAWVADSETCSVCQEIPAGVYDCEFDLQINDEEGYLLEGEIEMVGGDEFVWVSGLSDEGEPIMLHVEAECDLSFDEVMDIVSG